MNTAFVIWVVSFFAAPSIVQSGGGLPPDDVGNSCDGDKVWLSKGVRGAEIYDVSHWPAVENVLKSTQENLVIKVCMTGGVFNVFTTKARIKCISEVRLDCLDKDGVIQYNKMLDLHEEEEEHEHNEWSMITVRDEFYGCNIVEIALTKDSEHCDKMQIKNLEMKTCIQEDDDEMSMNELS